MADYSRQRAEREFNMNPPTNAPGQGEFGVSGWDSMEIDPNFNPADLNSTFGGGADPSLLQNTLNGNQGVPGAAPMAMPGVQTQMPPGQFGQQVQQTNETFGEKVERGLIYILTTSFKGFVNFIKAFFPAIFNNSARDWHKLGTFMCKAGVAEVIVSAVLAVIGIFVSFNNLWNVFFGGLFSAVVGFCIVAIAKGKIQKQKMFEKPSEELIQEPSFIDEPPQVWDEGDLSESVVDQEEASDSVWDWADEDGEEWTGEDDGSFFDEDTFDPVAEAEKVDVPAGQYTRSYLLETFLRVLPNISPNFYKMEPIYEDSDEFLMFEGFLKDSAMQTGISGEKLDDLYLTAVESNQFVIRLTANRPAGIKEQEIADGVADCYRRDEHGAVIEERDGCYASIDIQVGRFAINIFKCANVMVSLGDVLRHKQDWVSNPKVIMPLFWGVNEMGKVYCYDGVKAGNGSMLISGEGRSGKSWKGQCLIAQMSMFMSPKEVNFYFFDNKGKLSDYYYLSTKLPHVKGFCGDPLKYVSEIQKILEREKPIREKAIHSAGVNNINDYNKLNPANKLSYIYIVVDEMAAAMKEMDAVDKELHKQFNSLMLSIVTNLPYFGIRLLLFPHRLVDFIIDKTTAQQISCRSVVGVLDFETLKSALDIRNKKDFPYNLVKPGDMAIRTKDIRNGVATFTKSEVLSDSETTNRKIFDYIGAVWGKLEPDCKPCVRYDSSTSGKQPRDVSSNVGDYAVRNAFATPKDTIFTDEDDGAPDIDELLGDSNGEQDFWDAWKGTGKG